MSSERTERTYFSMSSAAEYLGISVRHFTRMIEDDEEKWVFWIGAKKFITRAKLEEWRSSYKPKPHNGRPKGIATLIRSAR